MTLAFFVVLVVTLLKKCCSDDKRKGKIPPLVFIETIELYFPDIDKEESWNEEKPEILVFGQKMSRQCFGFLSVLVIPIIVGTMPLGLRSRINN